MQAFTYAAKRLIAVHGSNIVYNSVQPGAYDVNTSSVTQGVTSNIALKSYCKNLKITQYNYPSLIGKEVYAFLIEVTSLGITPKVNDLITFNSKTYKVLSIEEHRALNEVVYYTILGVKS